MIRNNEYIYIYYNYVDGDDVHDDDVHDDDDNAGVENDDKL